MEKVNAIRPIVRGLEQLMKLRIQTGNRLAANFAHRNKIEVTEVNSPEDFEKLQKSYDRILVELKQEYTRITDAIAVGDADVAVGKLPRPKKFEPTPLISSYSELVLVDQYVRLIATEDAGNKQLANALQDIPLYTEYLEDIDGVGPKMAAVIISELDPHKAKYVSSYWAYAGVDTVITGEYTDDKGVTHQVCWKDILKYYDENITNEPMMMNGYPVTFVTIGRNRHKVSQVEHRYLDREKKESVRTGISFNPFLKTKLVGVLGPSFLKASTTFMDGEKANKKERLAKAREMGFDSKAAEPAIFKLADAFLKENGVKVWTQYSRFGEVYYAYRRRLENSNKPEHIGLTPAKIHARANRYAVKEFLRELHIVSRHLEGLPIYQSYEEAKLGYTHERNLYIYEKFGIDTTKLVKNTEQNSNFFPPAIQNYLEQRNQPCQVVQQ